MKYCLSCRQPEEVLRQSDEIKVTHKDYRIISDLLVNYPEAKVIWELPRDFEEYKKLILQYNEIGNFICCLNNLSEASWFQQNKVPFYYGYSVNTFYELTALEALGASCVKIAAPLTHCVKSLKNYKCEIRCVPNVAYDAYIPRHDGTIGGWVRPEDVQYYEEGIDVFEFEGNINLSQERTLWKVYISRKWPGNLNALITNLNKDIENSGLPDDFGQIRANCKQKCAENKNCHFCETAFNLSKMLERKVKENGKKK